MLCACALSCTDALLTFILQHRPDCNLSLQTITFDLDNVQPLDDETRASSNARHAFLMTQTMNSQHGPLSACPQDHQQPYTIVLPAELCDCLHDSLYIVCLWYCKRQHKLTAWLCAEHSTDWKHQRRLRYCIIYCLPQTHVYINGEWPCKMTIASSSHL